MCRLTLTLLSLLSILFSCTHTSQRLKEERTPNQIFFANTCVSHSQCPFGLLCFYGECTKKRPDIPLGLNGEICQLNSDCMSSSCRLTSPSNSQTICQPTSEFRSIDGEFCKIGNDCLSGICNTTSLFCQPQLNSTSCQPGGVKCEISSDCCSGECTLGTCTPHKLGDSCVTHKDCASGFCNTNLSSPRCWYGSP